MCKMEKRCLVIRLYICRIGIFVIDNGSYQYNEYSYNNPKVNRSNCNLYMPFSMREYCLIFVEVWFCQNPKSNSPLFFS